MEKYDVIVVGAGIAGTAAAIAAARENLRVLIIESSGAAGGAMSLSLVYPFMRYYTKNKDKFFCKGIFETMCKRFEKYADSSYEMFKMVFDDLLIEAGVDILYHATVFDSKCADRKISKVYVTTKSGTMEFESKFFIDASGDGALFAMSGCKYQTGRESDGLCQPMTTCFRISGVDIDLFLKDIEMLQRKYKEYQSNKKITNPRENILYFTGLGDGILHLNTTRIINRNPTDAFDLSQAEIEGRRQVAEMTEFLKTNSKAFENSSVISIANHIGIRESRKLKGVHILTSDELINCAEFNDRIALGNYCIDIHNPEGEGTVIKRIPDGMCYQIPYRSLLPKELDNLLVAGRCISATHEAHSAIRIMPICACIGEAAGTAIAIARAQNVDVHSVDIDLLQRKLIQYGAII